MTLGMRKDIRILQKTICINKEIMDEGLLLIFMENRRVVETHLMAIPEWFKYWSEEYPYYQLCLN